MASFLDGNCNVVFKMEPKHMHKQIHRDNPPSYSSQPEENQPSNQIQNPNTVQGRNEVNEPGNPTGQAE